MTIQRTKNYLGFYQKTIAGRGPSNRLKQINIRSIDLIISTAPLHLIDILPDKVINNIHTEKLRLFNADINLSKQKFGCL